MENWERKGESNFDPAPEHSSPNSFYIDLWRPWKDCLRCLEFSVEYIHEGVDWDKHLNELKILIASLAMQNVSIDKAQKKSMHICSLPESFKFY